MPTAFVWGGRALMMWLAGSMVSSAGQAIDASADLTEQARKALPWAVAGMAVYALISRGK